MPMRNATTTPLLYSKHTAARNPARRRRQAVSFSSRDYDLYLETLRAAASRYDCSNHAYVLMTNHTHLLITPGTKYSLPLLM
jgi:REP element-mobilizing transposase RayT